MPISFKVSQKLTPSMIIANDSNHSNCSTFGVEQTSQPKRLLDFARRSKSKKSSRKVRFNESRNKSYDNKTTVADETNRTWYARQDYEKFRNHNTAVVEKAWEFECQEEDCGRTCVFTQLLVDLYHAARAVNYQLSDASILLEKTPKNRQRIKELKKLYNKKGSSKDGWMDLIGLECHFLLSVKEDARRQRMAVQDNVQDVQDEYKKGLWNESEMYFEMRESCLNHSQAMGLFGQLLAMAQQQD
mmetsp:Transcript_12032/g.24855  ORF Transcript_12032/g.24855 Transcript_12032/m.24855 type:complete len:244 (-) Transcript_12032:238-969(-)|eukprot:CAMPEP_0172458324 /NCGR_PEP_ID=MMETSP1065-20121228/27059_1 /TAXON_ID=265537 /ORGANISM="Amphiprora paludosa, Strain CCMP125" /LENGTH=243 /DNA_ID=CAMNT_0013212523 /DNA_START=79 /DNA_END=810 /DNA_ORIENTATION=+